MGTNGKILTKGDQDNFNRRTPGELFLEFARTLNAKDQNEILSLKAVTEEAIIADFLKMGRENVHQEPADKF